MLDIANLRGRIAELGVRHVDVAMHLKMQPSLLSAILHGRRPAPADSEERVGTALDHLEAAERAAAEARARGVHSGPGSIF